MKPSFPILLFLLAVLAGPLQASAPALIPLVVAESEDFEIVGRLEEKNFIFFVDRKPSNQAVLAAQLALEHDGRTAVASFRQESGDYLINDPVFLAAFAQTGEYLLTFTLIAGEESDLLSAKFAVDTGVTASDAGPSIFGGWLSKIVLFLLLVLAVWRISSFRKGGAA